MYIRVFNAKIVKRVSMVLNMAEGFKIGGDLGKGLAFGIWPS